MICGSSLEYLDNAAALTCSYCGKIEDGHIRCPNRHYICDPCHNRDALKIITGTAFSTESKDPFEIAELMMSFPGLPMLGCQHAYIAGGALMAAIKNEGSRDIADSDIQEVFDRTGKQAHGGYCGLTGVCGIAPAIGASFAVLTGSKCGKNEEQRITMEAVTGAARAITELTGPSCCKAYARTSLSAAVEYLKKSLEIELPSGKEIVCRDVLKHPHGCREIMCPYFNGKAASRIESSPEVKLETLRRKALELGADKAKIIDTRTIVVEEWVRWKCLYGCPLYGKDAYHPPCAPDAASTKKVLTEYSKAIFINGQKGKALTEAAVRLEGEAYQTGFYKAFALTALSSGPDGAT
jgi:hypothetical protein